MDRLDHIVQHLGLVLDGRPGASMANRPSKSVVKADLANEPPGYAGNLA